MTKDEMKNRISMALKDPILQQGFKIICKNLVELEKENAELKEEVKNNEDLATVAYMQGAESQKKKVENQLTKAKDLINRLIHTLVLSNTPYERYEVTQKEAEQFLKEVEK